MASLSSEQLQLRSSSGEYIRDATLLAPATAKPQTLCLFLDGEVYLGKMDADAIIASLLDTGRIPAVASLFVSHVDTAHRHQDFPCNERYAAFIAEDAVVAARRYLPSLRACGHVVCGASLSGLAAAYLRVTYPDRFAAALCQSGSFWWNDEWLTRNLPDTSPGTYWISVGDQETQDDLEHAPSGMRQRVSQLDSVSRFVAALQAQAANTVRNEVFEGKHDPEYWKGELGDALEWLLDGR